MILNGEDQWKVTGSKGIFGNSILDHILEEDFGGQCPTMINYGFAITSIPAVQFDTSAALFERSNVSIHTRLSADLVAQQVGVVRRGDPIMGHGLAHVLIHQFGLGIQNVMQVGEHDEVGKAIQTK